MEGNKNKLKRYTNILFSSIVILCLYKKVKYLALCFLLGFFCFNLDVHCRGPPTLINKKFELIGGNKGEI